MNSPTLTVVMYHYVRDLQRTRFPEIKALPVDDFRRQLAQLDERYEMATLEMSLDFLAGDYRPARDLCLLTFDDGLKEHCDVVTPLLAERDWQGVFFVTTSCVTEECVAAVHMNHFLQAELGFAAYQKAFLTRLAETLPETQPGFSDEQARAVYRWDVIEVARFKYLFNFVLPAAVRDRVVRELFTEHLGDEAAFARALYLNWQDARQMQGAGMAIGGHAHQHVPLASFDEEEQGRQLGRCRQLLAENLLPQTALPFSYPYGKASSFNQVTIDQLKQLGFTCAFSTEVGANSPGADRFMIRRVDCREV